MFYGIAVCGLANLAIVLGENFCIGVYSSDPTVAAYAAERFHTVLIFQAIAVTYEVSGSYMRGLGYSMLPMLLTIFGTCVLRLGWVYIFRDIDNSFATLMTIYPVTWIVTGAAVVSAAFVVQRKAFAKKAPVQAA